MELSDIGGKARITSMQRVEIPDARKMIYAYDVNQGRNRWVYARYVRYYPKLYIPVMLKGAEMVREDNASSDQSAGHQKPRPEGIMWDIYIRGRNSVQLLGRLIAKSEAIAIKKARQYNSNAFVIRSDLDTISPDDKQNNI